MRDFKQDLNNGVITVKVTRQKPVVQGFAIIWEPPQLLGQDTNTIPESHIVYNESRAEVDINLRATIKSCMVKATPIYGMSSLRVLGSTLANWDSPHWWCYAAYFHEIGGTIEAKCEARTPRINMERDVLAHVCLSMTIISETYSRLLYFDEKRDWIILDEIHTFLFKEPVLSTSKLKGIMTPLVASAFQACVWGVQTPPPAQGRI